MGPWEPPVRSVAAYLQLILAIIIIIFVVVVVVVVVDTVI